MTDGFKAPTLSDSEEGEHFSTAHRLRGAGGGAEARKKANGSGSGVSHPWHRSSNSGSLTTSSIGSCGGDRYSSDATSRSSLYERGGLETSRFSDFHPLGSDFYLSEEESETEEQPAELVPLNIRTVNMTNYRNQPRKKMRKRFSDFYKLCDDHLGSGAYASVRTGVSLATGKEFAVKLVDKHEQGHTRQRVMREVSTFKLCINHPNIVQLHEWFEDNDYFYLVFEKMRGGPLLDHIQRKKFFTEQEASKVTKDVATALKFLHDHGIAHRDVKPENVLCSDSDRTSPVKLCDLDLASKANPPSPPKLPSVHSEPDLASPVGSAEFMAPEVVDAFVGDALKYDKRCDMWSLGVIVYIMICGYPPFYGECDRENCGWDQGLSCDDCQRSLFKRIQHGQFDFPEPEWENVSEEAKDLICHLLVKNVRERLTADEVLKHPWVKDGAPNTELQTPGNLFRNDSTRDVHQMQEHFSVMSRIVAARLSARIERSEKDSGESSDELPAAVPSAVGAQKTDSEEGCGFAARTREKPRQPPVHVVTAKVEATVKEQQSAKAPAAQLAENSNGTHVSPLKALEKCKKLSDSQFKGHEKLTKQLANLQVSGDAVKASGDVGNKVMTISENVTPQRSRVEQAHRKKASSQGFVQPPPVSLMPGNPSAVQYPLHVSQMSLASPPVSYANNMQMFPPQRAVPPPPPPRLYNVNGLLYYPPYVPLIPMPHVTTQNMFKFSGMPPPPHYMHAMPAQYAPYEHRNSNGVFDPRNGQVCGFIPQDRALCSPAGLLTVNSTSVLSKSPVSSGQQAEQLETCQGAMARQDSKTELCPCQARETRVNV